MTDVIERPPHLDEDLADLARRYNAARGVGIQVLNFVGGNAEGLLDRLPVAARSGLEAATRTALHGALEVAAASTTRVPLGGDWFKRTLTMGTGAAGGMGGLPSALAELPVTVTILLRAIQDIAAEHGIDPQSAEGREACLHVFSSAGPMADDDGAETGLLATRLTLTGAAINGLISKVAPRLSVVLGQKLATQTVPILGAAAGAATNYVFTSYYQDMARVHFGLMAASKRHNTPMVEVLRRFEVQVRKNKR